MKASASKWNFIPFKPGLVGGHCIGVDPYYLVHKSLDVGYKPRMILSGREINNDMPIVIVKRVLNLMKERCIKHLIIES